MPTQSQSFTWNTEEDFNSSQSRENICTSYFGNREGDTVRIGHDASLGLAKDAAIYIPLDGATDSGTGVVGRDITPTYGSDVSTYDPGILASQAVTFSGGSGLNYGSVGGTGFEHGGSFSLSMWVHRNRLQQSREVLASCGFNTAGDWHLEARDNGRLLFFYYDGGGGYNNTGSMHYGGMTTSWHYIGLTFDSSDPSTTIYLDDASETIDHSASRGTPSSDSTFRLGMMADRDIYPYDGHMDEFMYFNRTLSSSEHDELRNIFSGSYTSGWFTAEAP